jgi:hypothetical protein
MIPRPKVLIYGDTEWSVGSVHKNIEKYLKDDFDFVFYNWKEIPPSTIITNIDDYDIILTNLTTLNPFKEANISLNKFIFIAHGYPDIIGYNYDKKHFNDYNKTNAMFAVTSSSVSALYPKDLKLYNTCNGVNLDDFTYKQDVEKSINKVGWCGETGIKTKRYKWAFEITEKTDTLISIATSLPKESLKQWYHNIDLLIITAGPEEWMETGPLPAFEAIASGTLVIGTNVGNFKHIPGPKFDTVEEAVIIINNLKNDPIKIQELKREQYDCVKNFWTYEVLKDQWKDVFLECIERSKVNDNIKMTITEKPKDKSNICFITAIYGNNEASCKSFIKQTVDTDFICFTDNPNIESNGWIIDTTPYHLINPSLLDDESYINSLKNNTNSFNIEKYYKQAFQNIPRLKDYATIIWIDGNIQITYDKTSEFIHENIKKNKIITWHNEFRKGSLLAEVNEYMVCGRYINKLLPYQDVLAQYNEYLKCGYNENFFKDKNYHTEHMGVWITCFIAFSNKDKDISNLLDLWYLQTLKYTTQDQVGFSYVCQSMNIVPYTLPNHKIYGDCPHEKTQFYIKHFHGL